VFATNRPEDKKSFEEIRSLSQAVIQNGGSLHDIIELYSTDSLRQMKKVFKQLKDRQEQLQDQQMQMQQQQMEQQGAIAQAQMEQAQLANEQKIANDNYQAELDRINKKEIALINAESKSMGMGLADEDASGVPDVLEITKFASEEASAAKDYQLKISEIQNKNRLASEKLQLEREKIQLARENQANDLAVAKENAKGRATKKPK
jgi:predicted nuclease with TOPRIM domain